MRRVLFPLAIVMVLGATAFAQWQNVPPASVPRTPDGKVNIDREIEYAFDTDEPMLGRPPAGDVE